MQHLSKTGSIALQMNRNPPL